MKMKMQMCGLSEGQEGVFYLLFYFIFYWLSSYACLCHSGGVQCVTTTLLVYRQSHVSGVDKGSLSAVCLMVIFVGAYFVLISHFADISK